MSKKTQPLPYSDIHRGLKALGFVKQKNTSGSHEQWTRKRVVKGLLGGEKEHLDKVTVTKHHQPFHRELLSSMISQSNETKKHFLFACTKAGAKVVTKKRIKAEAEKANDSKKLQTD